MKKFLKIIMFLCVLSSIAYAEDDAMAILNRKRAQIEKIEKERAKQAKEAEERAKKEAEEQAKREAEEARIAEERRMAEEQAKAQAMETVETSAEVVAVTEGLSAQDEQEAMDILDGMRKKTKAEDEKALKLQTEAKELGITTSEVASLEEIEAMIKAKKAEKAKPKTEVEKLEATRKEALEKLDFYERVVRSVAREEAEVAGYYEIMNEDVKATEAAEQNTPVEENVQ